MADSDKDIGPAQAPQEAPAKAGVLGAFVVAGLLGAGAGLALWLFLKPGPVVLMIVGGAVIGALLRFAVLLSSDRKGLAKVEDEDGTLQ